MALSLFGVGIPRTNCPPSHKFPKQQFARKPLGIFWNKGTDPNATKREREKKKERPILFISLTFFHTNYAALTPLLSLSLLLIFPQCRPNLDLNLNLDTYSIPLPFLSLLLSFLSSSPFLFLLFSPNFLPLRSMENHHQNPQEREHSTSHPTSPNSTASSSSTSTSSKGVAATATATIAAVQVPSPPILLPPTPKSIPRSFESNPYPTTFIQADSSSFKQVVQMLTGSAETAAKHAAAPANPPPPKNPIPTAAKATGPKKPAFKLYERRSSLKNLKMISPLIPTFLNSAPASPAGGAFSPRKKPEILSPSTLDLHSLVLSPVTPLILDPFNRSPQTDSSPSPAMSAEERAISEKGFFLHPSPRNTQRDAEPPRLLPLFPVTSPRISAASVSSP